MVLAAGGARRFGSAKLLAPLHGRPVLAHTLDAVRRARGSGVLTDARVVVAAGAAAVADVARAAGLPTVLNDAPEAGLSGSLRRGLAALGDADAAVILLGDQPLVRAEVVAALVAAWRTERPLAVRPQYSDTPDEPGHPVLLDRWAWGLADQLEGDTGVGSLLSALGRAVALVEVPGRNPDVDTLDDLRTLEGPPS